MDEELGTDPELLWPLLLAQIVYDVLERNVLDFDAVAKIYRKHPLLPYNAPVLETPAAAEQVYGELLRDNDVSDEISGDRAQAQALAEKLYARFHENLTEKISEDQAEFVATYRRLEQENKVPKEERILEE